MLLKREDLNHTGSHKINNVLGQALLAERMGKTRLVAETGAGQHGVATATAAALLGMECMVYMGEVDMERQALNVFRMRLLGAEVVPALSGSRTLKDAVNEAMRDWVATVETTHYCLGSVMGPHPYPWMVREFHRVIGDEAREQCAALLDGDVPDVVTACVGGGSNAIGHLLRLRRHPRRARRRRAGRRCRGHPWRARRRARHALVPDAGRGRPGARSRSRSRPGSTTRASGPSTRTSPSIGRARYETRHRRRGDRRLPAAVAHRGDHPGARAGPRPGLGRRGPGASWPGATVLLNLSGRGDKDVAQMMDILG